jgi:hypothetical protein
MDEPDWKTLLCKVLEAIGAHEGTWGETAWEAYGVSAEERQAIEEAYQAYEAERDRHAS